MNLLVEFYDSHDRRRNAENLWTLHENLCNPLIRCVHLFVDSRATLAFSAEKLTLIHFDKRPTFKTFLDYANEHLSGETCVIANSDISFNSTLQLAEKACRAGVVLALSRWEIDFVGQSYQYRLFDNAASQDAWIFKAPIPTSGQMEFCLGVPGCDNRIAEILFNLGCHVRNPAKRVVAIHFHQNVSRLYSEGDRVPGPYRLIAPTDDLNCDDVGIVVAGFDSEGHPLIAESHDRHLVNSD